MDTEGLKKAVSSGGVVTQPEKVEGYGAGRAGNGRKPDAVVFPKSADEVSAVTRWAGENGARLIPVSSAAPHRTAVPARAGYVAVDLSGMKQIVRADRRNRVALIEAGVTFPQLEPELARVGLRPMKPLAARAGKSVLAAYLDRTPTMVPRAQWDLADPLLCTEVVMGTGKVFRTGCSAGPGTLEEQWATGQAQKNPMGPSSFDFFRLVQGSRGSMGTVTWASIKCELLPLEHELIMLASDDLATLAEVVYHSMRAKWGEECLVLEAGYFERLTGAAAPSRFVLLIGVTGNEYRPKQRLAYQRKGILGIVQQEGLRPVKNVGGVGSRRMLEVITSSPEEDWKDIEGGHQDIYFLTTLDQASGFVSAVDGQCEKEGFDSARVGIYLQPQLGGRVTHFEVTVFHTEGETEKALAFSTGLARELARRGAYFSRPAGVFEQIPYEDKPLLVDTFRRARKLFDPAGVMNPDALCFKEVV
jgi:FAD/FMN-containing dehydrogenase